jgi:hypothetical protein
VCLFFKKEQLDLDPNKIVSTSFLAKPSSDHRHKNYHGKVGRGFLSKKLTDSIKERGQQNRIICTKHHIKDAPVRINLLEDPEMEKIKVYEGHHRMVSCEELGIPVRADVYHFYHMNLLHPPVDELPNERKKDYQSNYDDSFWSEWREEDRSLARKTNQIALVPAADDKNRQEEDFNTLRINYKLVRTWKGGEGWRRCEQGEKGDIYVLWP